MWLERGVRTEVPRGQDEETEVSEAPTPDEVPAQGLPESQHTGRQREAFVYEDHRMSVFGKSPKEARPKIRAELEAGFCTYRSGKKKVRTLHQLGRCYLLPGVDYLDCSFPGKVMPQSAGYNGVCRRCARDGVRDEGDSSATVSSSSSSDDKA